MQSSIWIANQRLNKVWNARFCLLVMNMQESAESTESWSCEPLSGRALGEIVQDAENSADLVTYIRKPEIDLDFRLKFIAEHEEFFNVQLSDRESRIRTVSYTHLDVYKRQGNTFKFIAKGFVIQKHPIVMVSIIKSVFNVSNGFY